MKNIAVLGSGGWGTALSVMLCKYNNKVSLWSPFSEEINTLSADRENKKLLKGIMIPNEINLTTDISCVKNADLVIFAVPSFAVRETAIALKGILKENAIVVNVSKGIERGSLLFLSEVIKSELPSVRMVVLSGPSHAEEVARSIPTSIVSASDDIEAAHYVQDVVMNENFRIYTNYDVIGVELSAAFKNIIALAAGISDGMGLGDNTKAALMTRGLSEITRLCVKLGAKESTFAGLAGIGDLIVTCTSMHSRNRRFGILVGKGMEIDEALKEIGMTVEGYHASKAAWEFSRLHGVEMPIIDQCYKTLYMNLDPRKAIDNLMIRPKKSEVEIDFNEKAE